MPLEEAAPEGSATEVAAPETPSMEDSIRARFRELTASPPAEEVSEETAPAEAPPVKKEPPKKDPATGKFLKKESEVSTPADEVADPAEPAVAEAEEPPAEEAPAEPVKPPTKFAKAPSSYRPDITPDWDKTPESVRAEIHKREDDMHRGIQQYKQLADVGKLFDNEFRPFEAMIRAGNTTAPQLVRNWLATEYQLQTASPQKKAELFATYAKQYGIDMEAVSTAYQAGPIAEPPTDPRVADLERQMNDMRTAREREIGDARQREQEVIRKEVEAFASAAGHEHYDDVKLDMAALLKEGRAETLQDAYDKATWANPTVREKLRTQQSDAERKQAAEKAAAAKKATSTNIAKRGTPPAKPVVGTMDDTLRARYRELTGASA